MITESYFAWRDVEITNIIKLCNDRNSYALALIKRLEQEALRMTLGVCLYEEFKTQLDVSGNLKSDVDQKWKDLVYGKIYDAPHNSYGCSCSCSNCKKHQWQGILDKSNKRSYLAFYIYSQWAFDNESQSFSTGEQVASVNNSETVSNHIKRVHAHNNFVNWVQCGYADGRVSLYEYMADHEDDFPEFAGQCFKHMNVWSI